MTNTNQAFIKAYRHDAAQGAPASPAMADAERAATASVQESASAASGERSALYGPRPLSAAGAMSPQRPVRAGQEKQPLSSFIARPLNAPPAAQSADAEFLRPGTTIASFQWPPVCRALTQQCGEQLDRVADLITVEATAGRSLIGMLGLFPVRGTTTTTLCLAARLAGRGRRVMLVDANFCRPRLASWLEVVPTAGWQEVLKQGTPLADAVIRAKNDRLDLLALVDRKTENAERLVGGLQAIVTAGVLRHAYDVVLFDMGAFFDSASQPIIVELVRNMGIDGVLVVTGPQPADARDLDIVAAQIGRNGCELLGMIENRVAKP
ncbi:MAG: hypothetical protein WD738_06000 [Pirellulales bacterium]